MKYPISIILFFSIFSSIFGQENITKYLENIKKADSLYGINEFENSAKYYQLAFKNNNNLGKVGHRYKAAICYCKLNKIDSAFNELFKICNNGKFSNYEVLLSESNFKCLQNDARWGVVLQTVKMNYSNKSKVLLD